MSKIYRAIARSMGSKYLTYAIQFASLMMLARLFSPEVFGLVASVQVFYLFFQLLADGGLAPAVIGLDALERKDRDGIFGLTVAAGLLLAGAFLFLTPAITNFYEVPALATVVPYICVALIFNTMSILPIATLQRQQSFYQLATAGVIGELIALAVVLIARTAIEPLHALALRLPIYSFVNYAIVHFCTKWTDFGRPRPGSHFSAVRPLLKVAGFQMAFNALNYFSRNLDKILIAKYMGAATLGIYDRSYSLMRYPLQLLTFAMTPAIQPVLRSHSNDPAFVRQVHNDLALKLSLLAVACATGIYFMAETIVVVAFGKQWIASVPIIRLLSLSIPVQVVLSTSGSFFQTFNRTDLMFICGVFSAATNVTAIVWGVSTGNIELLCWALFVSFHVNFIQAYYLLHKSVLNGGMSSFLVRLAPAAVGIITLVGIEIFRGP
jgi:PST family polysaccharide transporter